jgi:hypothetical protein
MAITTTTIAGTDSLSGSRITINDNFKTLENALNSVLSAFDLVSGRFDNATYGSANDIITNGITITGIGLTNALTINNGNINILLGDVKVTDNYGFYIGNLLELNKQDITLTLGGTYPTWDFRSPGATSNTVGGMVLPHLDASGFAAIDTTTTPPVNGTLVFTDAGPGVTPLKLWWTTGPSGATWYNVAVV